MDIQKTTKLVEAATGEILFTGEEAMDFYLFNDRGYLLHNNQPCVRLYRYEWPVATVDRLKLIDLAGGYMDRRNALMRKDRPNHPLTVQLMAPLVGLSLNRTYGWMKRLTQAGVVVKAEGVYYVNPLYLMGAPRLSPNLYRLFGTQIRDMPSWVHAKYKELLAK